MADTSLISVIIPVYGGERYLAEAVESVLAQTYRPIRVIILDYESTDGCRDVAKRFGLLVRHSFRLREGLGAAGNRGMESARRSLGAFLDASDLWVEDKLTRQMAVFGDRSDSGNGLWQDVDAPEMLADAKTILTRHAAK